MKQIVKLMCIASVGYVFACPAIAAVGVVSTCSNFTEIDCSTYANYSTSTISGTTPNLQNDTMTFSGIYCGGSGDSTTRKCYRNTTNNSVGLAMDCKYNYSIHSSNTTLEGRIQIGSCIVGFTAYPIGTSSSTVSPGSTCSTSTECGTLSGTNGCLGWGCTSGRCVCVYCASGKTIVASQMGCDCIKNSANCSAANGGYSYADSGTGWAARTLTFIGDETCLNANTVCSDLGYFCLSGYYCSSDDCKNSGDDCVRCPTDSGGKYGITSGTGAQGGPTAIWDNFAHSITDCYMTTNTTSNDTSGSFTYSSNCYYR